MLSAQGAAVPVLLQLGLEMVDGAPLSSFTPISRPAFPPAKPFRLDKSGTSCACPAEFEDPRIRAFRPI
jgi:hypothetical protein